MRLLIAAATSCLALALASCSGGSPEGGDVSAKDSEASFVASVKRAVTLASDAIAASEVDVVGGWESCMGGYRYRGTGSLYGGSEATDSQVEGVREALTGAGFTDVTQVAGHVSIEKGDLVLDIARPGSARPLLWTVSFHSDCRLLSGDDQEYAERSEHRRLFDLQP